MASSVFARYLTKAPVPEHVQAIILDYFSGAVDGSYYVGSLSHADPTGRRFIVTLAGTPSFAFRRVPGYEHMAGAMEKPERPTRFIEVTVRPDHIEFLTREQDHFTNDAARNLAALFARFYDGAVDENP